jgi:anhydro-N-acetylmuramic acid kinase
MLIDDAVRRMTGGAMQCDVDGRIAACGVVNGALLESLMSHSYLQQRPPKTTGRETFGAQFGERVWRDATVLDLRPQDIVATLTMFTTLTIAQAYRDFLPSMPDEMIVSGGGARNPTLMRMLRDALGETTAVMTSDEIGIPGDAKEAMAFAMLAYRTVHGRAGNLPSATGASRAVILGDITPSQHFRGLHG